MRAVRGWAPGGTAEGLELLGELACGRQGAMRGLQRREELARLAQVGLQVASAEPDRLTGQPQAFVGLV